MLSRSSCCHGNTDDFPMMLLGVGNPSRKIIAGTRIGSKHRRFSDDVVGSGKSIAENHRCHPRSFLFAKKRTTLLIGCNKNQVGRLQERSDAAPAWSGLCRSGPCRNCAALGPAYFCSITLEIRRRYAPCLSRSPRFRQHTSETDALIAKAGALAEATAAREVVGPIFPTSAADHTTGRIFVARGP